VVPDYTRAVGIVQPVATAVREDPPAEETVLVPVPADANPTTFSLFIERPGANLDNSWPGKNADGTTLVGRIPLAGAGTCCVVALQQPLQPGRADFPRPSHDELRWMRDVAARGPLITTIIGLMVAIRLEPESIDTLGLTAEGKSLHLTTDRLLLERIPVGTVFRREFDAVPEDCSVPEILGLVSRSRSGTFPVVNAAGELTGILSFASLRTLVLEKKLESAVVARDLCDPPPTTLTTDDGLGRAFRLMEAEGLEDVPVVDRADPRRLVGMLSRADLIAAYNRTVATLSASAIPAWLRTAEPQWADRYRVVPVEVPEHWVGRTLREIDCRARYGVAVLAVQRSGQGDDGGYELPDPDRALAPRDVLVLAGTLEGLRLARAA